MSRYDNIEQKSDNGRRVLRSTLYPPIPRTSEDIYVRTTKGDRLDQLSHKYYGSVEYVWIIAEANGVGKGSYSLPAGLQLRIPAKIDAILEAFRNLNSL